MGYFKRYWPRLCLTIGLLVPVWRNAHWSVALAITLLTINAEITGAVFHLRRQQETKTQQMMKGMFK